MKPSSFSWLLSVKSTANQMKVASTSPSLAMSSSVRTPVASRTRRGRGTRRPSNRAPASTADAQSATMPSERREHDLFLDALSGPSAASARRAAAGASGVAVTSGRNQPVEQQRQQRPCPRASAREAASSHEPNPISTPKRSRDLRPERVGGHRRQPERRRQAQADDAREHQEARRARCRPSSPAWRPPPRRARTPAG